MTQTVTAVVVTDGGALDLATAIICLAYGMEYKPGHADTLKERLGLTTIRAHSVETAFSYPNAVGLVTENGRTSLYLFDSEQEDLVKGGVIRRLNASESGTDTPPLPTPGVGNEAVTRLPTALVDSGAANLSNGVTAQQADPVEQQPVITPANETTGAVGTTIGTTVTGTGGEGGGGRTLISDETDAMPATPADPVPALTPGEPAKVPEGTTLPEVHPLAGDEPYETGISDVQELKATDVGPFDPSAPIDPPAHPYPDTLPVGEGVQLTEAEKASLAPPAEAAAATLPGVNAPVVEPTPTLSGATASDESTTNGAPVSAEGDRQLREDEPTAVSAAYRDAYLAGVTAAQSGLTFGYTNPYGADGEQSDGWQDGVDSVRDGHAPTVHGTSV